jgi:TolB protein
VYESTKYGRPEILIIDYNGSTSGRITDDDAIDGNPSWSPDGEQIIYYSTFDNTHDNFIQNFDIYLYDLNDSTSINLTKNAFFDVAPAWSLDGNHVYYNTERDSSEQLMRLNLITGSDQIIMDKIEHHNAISISPDNQMFLAITYGNDGNWDVSVFDFKSLEKVRSFQHPAREGQPLWSPDGSKITFSSNRGGKWNIYIMNVDGSGLTNLTNNFGNSRFYSWFPDGKMIVYSSDNGQEEGQYKLHIMNADGSDKRILHTE